MNRIGKCLTCGMTRKLHGRYCYPCDYQKHKDWFLEREKKRKSDGYYRSDEKVARQREYRKQLLEDVRKRWVDTANANRKKKRHELGISKRYGHSGPMGSRVSAEHKRELKRLHRKKYKYSRKQAGKLPISRIQTVYEDNIKKYGTLTCYLCLNPIVFGKDNLEHRIPLSHNGTNEYDNLAVACQSCNCKKYDKTETEYRKTMEGKITSWQTTQQQ